MSESGGQQGEKGSFVYFLCLCYDTSINLKECPLLSDYEKIALYQDAHDCYHKLCLKTHEIVNIIKNHIYDYVFQ